uniref:Rad50/SbcC-type AAA domain-containing protein n=1 Tax=Rhodosorus marinus TaxID=101924 RepID=A0A7S2ZXA5_9RHOD|mmetsp:Transcript_35004/g.138676  ORF Transcript_35004/g.138676 Transcript_35004/m.138676 type:complete len:471 (+) Transcript_35004:141-1553(+)
MTTIDKIGISGIRSFEPQNEVTLRFFKPLTIILGHNGAGKTTVIECIKMACAGDPPPFTDKGGAFIHDPKIASTTETKAKIRLQFTDVSNKKIIVNRQFQVTNKANRRQEFKTVEQSLQYTNEHGEKQTISHRCNDINKTVPELMGVSKAILENVIFVHQEESMWPLGDGKKLKEKFDDIFASTRYTKALESIRKQRKEHSIIVREKKGELILWKDRVERAEKLTSEYDKVKEEKQGLDDEVKSLEDQVSTVQADLNEIEEKLRGVKTIKERVQKMEAQKQAKEDAKQHVFSELEDELEDDDSELMNWINQANEKLESIKTSRATRQDQITETSKTIENLQEEHKLLTSQQGRLQAVELILAETREEMANVKADLVSRGENVIEGNALADTDSDERWDKMLELKQRRAEAELENSMEENRKKLSANQAELNEVKLQTKQLETSMKDTQELLAHKRQTAFKLRESLRTSTS